MGWLAFFLLLASSQSDVPRAPPPPPDPTMQMWVGIVMGVVLAIPVGPFAYRGGQHLGEIMWGWWTSRSGDMRAKGE